MPIRGAANVHQLQSSNLVQRINSHAGDRVAVYFDLQTPITVGRSADCDIQVKDPAASRVHCRLVPDKNHVWLYDAGSRWGTFVNGRRVWSCELYNGDQITIGNSSLRFVWTACFGLQQHANQNAPRHQG